MALPNAALIAVALRHGRYTGLVGIAVGTAMVAWILVELAFIRELSFFHPLYVAVGLLMVWAGFRVVRVDHDVRAAPLAELRDARRRRASGVSPDAPTSAAVGATTTRSPPPCSVTTAFPRPSTS